jgi:hypothetical protein
MMREIETRGRLSIAQLVTDIEGGATKKLGDAHSPPAFLLHFLESENTCLCSY